MNEKNRMAAKKNRHQRNHTPDRSNHNIRHPNRRGPFDIIGDVHGCTAELDALLRKLGYASGPTPPAGRTAVFVGDLIDRGPDSVGALRRVMDMVAAGAALCVMGNHDAKLLKKLQGRNVQLLHGLDRTVEHLFREPPAFVSRVRAFLESLPSHLILDDGRLVVAHAGIKESMIGQTGGGVREFTLYGDTTGKTDEFGLPVRRNWAADYGGEALIVYGHTPQPAPLWQHNTVNIDTGCAFGGALTALRYPEREVVQVPAHYTYAVSARPIAFERQAPPMPRT